MRIDEIKKILAPNGFISTFSGRSLSLLNPDPKSIVLDDIARGLANKGYFGGQTPKFYSIAQHSLLVYQLVYLSGADREESRAALLHDGAEGFINDMLKPLKVMLPVYCEVEEKISRAIFTRFDIDYDLIKRIKPADTEAQEIAYSAFFVERNYEHVGGSPYLSPSEALAAFHKACSNEGLR